MKKIKGSYAIYVSLPLYGLSCSIDNFIKNIKGKEIKQTRLPKVSWKSAGSKKMIKIYELAKVDGNVRKGELAILSASAADAEPGTNLFEIGTFDGRTTLNLALNSPADCKVYTLDLPPDSNTRHSLAGGERVWVEKHKPGMRIEKYINKDQKTVAKIEQLFGDSASFDFTPFHNSCSMVFIDGSHSYNNVISDSESAMEITKNGGIIWWHDYGVWEDVTKALEEFKYVKGLELYNIADTSLVFMKK